MTKFKIHDAYITLGQFLKAKGYIGSGGEAKFFLLENAVLLNGERRMERGKKLYPNDIIVVMKDTYVIDTD